jgi:uncharacterized protein
VLVSCAAAQVKQGVQSKRARFCNTKLGRTFLSKLLPLFPLDAVLLPGIALPLHVFEPRYKEMIGECLAEKKPFGVVRTKEDGVADVGCTAEIMAVTKNYPDGRMDIATEGRERFEVIEVNQERAFLQAEVLYLRDETAAADSAEIAEVLELHEEIMGLAGSSPDEDLEVEQSRLSFHLAGSLPFDLDFKQALLQMNSEMERVQAVLSFFRAILPTMRRSAQVRKIAGGNGHVH